MRFLSFKALFVLVVLPPVLYVVAIRGLEGYLEHHYRGVIANRIPGDTQTLLTGRRLYPPTYSDEAATDPNVEPMRVTSENYALLNEAELFDEVEALENKLQQNLSQQNEQQNRVQALEDPLDRLAREREALSLQRSKVAGGYRRRMDTLYKNTSFAERSLMGLAELPETMQIKAEEAIHQLGAQADTVPIKRKIFRGKGKETVFEIVFARKGRLYFRRTKARKVDILAIGTKNTQEKDLVYLDRL